MKSQDLLTTAERLQVHLTCAALTGPSPLSLTAHSRCRVSPRPSLLPRNCHLGWRIHGKAEKVSILCPLPVPVLMDPFPKGNVYSSFMSQTHAHSWLPRNHSMLCRRDHYGQSHSLLLPWPRELRKSGATILIVGAPSPLVSYADHGSDSNTARRKTKADPQMVKNSSQSMNYQVTWFG